MVVNGCVVGHHVFMDFVRVEVTRWSDVEFPGWVEVELRESDGAVATLIDKVPVFDAGDRLAVGVELPVGLEVPCDVLDWEVDKAGNAVAVVRLHFSITDQRGRSTFRVNEDTLASHS
jgi:hypothetical protein